MFLEKSILIIKQFSGFHKSEVVLHLHSVATTSTAPVDSSAVGKALGTPPHHRKDSLSWEPQYSVCKVAYLKGACLHYRNLLGKGAIISTTGSPEVEEATWVTHWHGLHHPQRGCQPSAAVPGSEPEEKRCISSSGILEGERNLFQKPVILSGI